MHVHRAWAMGGGGWRGAQSKTCNGGPVQLSYATVCMLTHVTVGINMALLQISYKSQCHVIATHKVQLIGTLRENAYKRVIIFILQSIVTVPK